MKVHLHGNFLRERIPILCGWLELPLFHRFDRFFVQTMSERLDNLYVRRLAVGIDDQCESYDAFNLLSPRFIAEFGLDVMDQPRRSDAIRVG